MIQPVYPETLTSARTERYTFELLDRWENSLGELFGVVDGTLEWNNSSEIKTGGSILYAYDNRDYSSINWLTSRIKIRYEMKSNLTDEYLSWDLGVYLPASPSKDYSDTTVERPLELYDKLLILVEDCISRTYSLDAYQGVTDTVTAIIKSSGETNVNIKYVDTLTGYPRSWEPGTSKLRIINDLLESINYRSLYCDGAGQYRSENMPEPNKRRVEWNFQRGSRSIHRSTFTIDEDGFNVPNRIVLIGAVEGDDAPLIANYSMQHLVDTGVISANNQFTAINRGREITQVVKDVQAANQNELNKMCLYRLLLASTVTKYAEIEHAVLDLRLNDRVMFHDSDVALDAILVRTTIPLKSGGLMKTSLRGLV